MSGYYLAEMLVLLWARMMGSRLGYWLADLLVLL
jgi:hypothetical protein